MSQNNENIDDKSNNTNQKILKKIQNLEGKYLNITKDISMINSEIKYNTPINIYYKEKLFVIVTRNYYDKIEYTWRCKYFRRKTDKPKDQKNFCSASIKGIKKDIFNNTIIYFLKQDHSQICNKLNVKISPNKEDNISYKDSELNNAKEESNFSNNNMIKILKQKLDRCNNAEEIDNLILEECKQNKELIINKYKFQKDFETLYKYKNIKIKKYHLLYLYNKFTNICFNLSFEEIPDYCNKNEDLGLFCRDIQIKNIFDL